MEPIRRRTFLQAGSLSALGLTLPQLLALRAARATTRTSGSAKACILLYMTGGPAQQETFDMKPNANVGYRGDFNPIATSVPGVEICEHLPMLARNAQHFAIIRSTYHNSNTHGVGVHYNLTGLLHAPRTSGEPQLDRRDPPCIGGVIRQLRGDKNGLPASMHLPVRIGDQNNFQWGGQHAGFLGPQFDPLMLIDEKWTPGVLPPGFTPAEEITAERQSARTHLLDAIQGELAAGAGFPAAGYAGSPASVESNYLRYQHQALDILGSGSVWRAFCLDDERPETLNRYGDNKFGRSCLVARRLVEAGVGLVTVPWMYLVSVKNFDTHSNHFQLMRDVLLPPVDQAFSALLEDLDQRGRLPETLVAWTGEFGRTPKVNQSAGRDHWGSVYSTVLAGGGIRGGQVYGRSDNVAGLPADNPVHASDFVATIYHALGYGKDSKVFDVTGRPHYIVQGTPVEVLFR